MAKKTTKKKKPEKVEENFRVKKQKPTKQRKIIKWVLLIILAVFILTIGTFAVGIYGFSWQNKPAKTAVKIIPYPAVLILDNYFPYLHGVRLSSLWSELGSVEKYFKEFQKLDLSEEKNQEQYNKMRVQIEDQMVDNKIITEQARVYDVKVDQKAIDEEYKKIVEANGGEAKVKETIEMYYGWTVDQFKQKIKDYLLRQDLEKKLREDDKLGTGAKEKAEEILVEVKKPNADFAELAKKYSQDEQTAQQGGDLGKFGKGKMMPEFEEVAFSLEPGQISEVVETEFGYHIIKVDEKTGEEVHARHILIKTKSFNDWLAEKKKEAKIWKFYK
jgi:hypothetical protein